MANLLPILLLAGGAAVVMGKKKKKKPAGSPGDAYELPETTPPPLSKSVKKSGSGYPGISRERMQEIQTFLLSLGFDLGTHGLDGRYGSATKKAIVEFQKLAGLEPDGKPGKNTQAALKKAEAGRLGDQCDPLDQSTWRGGVCVLKEGQWVRQAAKKVPAKKAPAKVKVGSREVYISPDYKQLKIGSNWKIKILDKFLEERRRSGKLITDPKGVKVMDVVLHDPSLFLGELVGFEGDAAQNAGYAIYGALWIIATGGIAGEVMAAAGAQALAMPLAVEGMVAATGISAVGGMAGVGISAHYKLWGSEVLAATGLESIAYFMDTHYVTVGSKRVSINKLPLGHPAVQKLNKFIADYTYAFQTRTYEG